MAEQIKTKKRVTDHGEVFTNQREIDAMCDMVKTETERIDSRFLEPACGDGNFLITVLERKMQIVKKKYKKSSYDYERNSLLALGSLYGVELLNDNVEMCRKRLYDYWEKEYKANCKKEYSLETCKSAKFILSRNIVCGNALSLKCVDETGNDVEEPIVFSEWTFPFNDFRMQRKDYTFDELLNKKQTKPKKNMELTLFPEEDAEGKFLKQYISHYRKIYEEEE